MQCRFAKLALFTVGYVAAGLLAGSAWAGTYVYTVLAVPGALATYPQAINKAGEVAGAYVLAADSSVHGFTWSNGTFTRFDGILAGRQVAVATLNDGGTVAAANATPKGAYSDIFLHRANGTRQHVTLPAGARDAYPYGISRDGVVTGVYVPASNLASRVGFSWHNGIEQDLSFPGSSSTFPRTINGGGAIGGIYEPTGPLSLHGFLFQNGTYTNIDPPGTDLTVVSSINDHGLVAGYFYEAKRSSASVGFIYDHGGYKTYKYGLPAKILTTIEFAMSKEHFLGEWYDLVANHIYNHLAGVDYDVHPPGTSFTGGGGGGAYSTGFNMNGDVIGRYTDAANTVHAFVAQCPVSQAPCTD